MKSIACHTVSETCAGRTTCIGIFTGKRLIGCLIFRLIFRGFEFWFLGFGFRVLVLGFRVKGLGFRVKAGIN